MVSKIATLQLMLRKVQIKWTKMYFPCLPMTPISILSFLLVNFIPKLAIFLILTSNLDLIKFLTEFIDLIST